MSLFCHLLFLDFYWCSSLHAWYTHIFRRKRFLQYQLMILLHQTVPVSDDTNKRVTITITIRLFMLFIIFTRKIKITKKTARMTKINCESKQWENHVWSKDWAEIWLFSIFFSFKREEREINQIGKMRRE